MEEQSLRENQPRVKFAAQYKGTLDDFFEAHPGAVKPFEILCLKLRSNLISLEKLGVAPMLPDGKIGGNGGAVLSVDGKDCLVVSKSGKEAQSNMDIYKDFVIVESFNESAWSCDYYSCCQNVKPTSDTPLYYTALIRCKSLLWKSYPTYMLHGHAFETEEDAHKLGIPISSIPTLFSTREDAEALYNLMKEVPFPGHQMYVRKGHGFVVLGYDPEHAWGYFEMNIEPHLKSGSPIFWYTLGLMLKYVPLLVFSFNRK